MTRVVGYTMAAMVAAAFACAGAAAPDAPDAAALLEQLHSADAGARTAAVDALSQAGPAVVGPLFDLIGAEDHDADLAARLTVQRMVQSAAAPQSARDRAELSRRLAEQARSDRPVEARNFAIRMLSFVGGDEVVPALAGLLADPQLGEFARWALARIPGRAATEALAAALPGAAGEMRIGLINALGARGEVAALPALEAAAEADDQALRAAALEAIARIPSPRSENLLRARIESGRDQAVAWDAYLRLAEATLAAGRRGQAERAYRYIYQNAPNDQLRCAGVIGLGNVGAVSAVRTVLDALDRPERDLHGAAVEALVGAPGADATKVIAERMQMIAGPGKLLLVEILGRRGDPAAGERLAIAGAHGEEALRVAATAALGEAGDAAAVPALVGRLADSSPRVREAARLALVRVRGEDATRAEIEEMGRARGEMRATIALALGDRKDAQAVGALLGALGDYSQQVRLAALAGLAVSAGLTDAAARSRLVQVVRTAGEEERQAAGYALSRVPPSVVTAEDVQAMRAAAEDSPAPARAALVQVIAKWNKPDLLPFFLESTQDRDDGVVVAALAGVTRLLPAGALGEAGGTPESMAARLLAIAENGTPAVRAGALEGYLVLADQRRASDPAGALGMYHEALRIAADDANRRTALRGVAAIGSPDSLPLVEPLLEGGAVAGDAAAAVMPIADKLAQAGDKRQAAELYRKAIRVSSDRELLGAAVERLRSLGVEMDIAGEAGFITHWWVLGPFPGRKEMMQRDVIPTDAAIDVAAPVVVEGRSYEWKYTRVSDPAGMLDFREVVAPQDDVAAYAYAEVTSDAARDVIFKIGSDDAVVCWLNGQRIHLNDVERGYAPDEDLVPARLRAGANPILLKVVNGGADWAGGLRITDANNLPLRLPQRGP